MEIGKNFYISWLTNQSCQLPFKNSDNLKWKKQIETRKNRQKTGQYFWIKKG